MELVYEGTFLYNFLPNIPDPVSVCFTLLAVPPFLRIGWIPDSFRLQIPVALPIRRRFPTIIRPCTVSDTIVAGYCDVLRQFHVAPHLFGPHILAPFLKC